MSDCQSRLRPQEICAITLDDISFGRATLQVKDRKTNHPIKLPLPEDVIKAIAAYLIGVRPESNHRNLFLTLKAPYEPLTPGVVGYRHPIMIWKSINGLLSGT